MRIESDDEGIVEQNGERYLDLGNGVYALIIEEEEDEGKYKPKEH